MLNVAVLVAGALWAQQFGGPFTPAVPPPPAPMPALPQHGDLPRGVKPGPAYGEAGTSELTGAVAPSANGGWGTSLGYRRFFWDGVAPGLGGTYFSYGTLAQIWLRASLRIAPLRLGRFALAITPEAAGVIVWGYQDGWAYGGSVTAIFAITRHFAVEGGAELFLLSPESFSHSAPTPRVYGPVLALDVFI